MYFRDLNILSDMTGMFISQLFALLALFNLTGPRLYDISEISLTTLFK